MIRTFQRPKPFRSIPKEAELVFTGKIYKVFQWQQKMFDGSYSTFEMLKRPDTATVIPVTDDSHILLIKEKQPSRATTIGTPGGRIDENEDILEAAKRELLEETGYSSLEWELFSYTQPAAEKIDWFVYTFLCRNCKKTKEMELDNGEDIELLTVSFDEFIDLIKSPDFRDSELQLYVYKHLSQPDGLKELKRKLIGDRLSL